MGVKFEGKLISVKVANKMTEVKIVTVEVKAPMELTKYVLDGDPVRVTVEAPQQKLFKKGG